MMRILACRIGVWLSALLIPIGLSAQPEPPIGPSAAELLHGIQKAQVLGTVLYVAAHPDDENTALLAYLAKGRKYRTAYLSLTRGDGGQNLIGPEQGPLLGLIRTQELLAARRIDGAEQYFTRAIDYGYSKHPDEAFRIWHRDSLLHDVVWIIRKLQPDVIITRFDPNGAGTTHGHHTVSAIIALEAFQAAADPKRFPEQLKFVKPWQAKRIFWNTYAGFSGQTLDKIPAGTAAVDVGEFNPLLGESYTEIAGRSRSMHRSQGFGAPRSRGTRMEYLQLLAGEPFQKDFMDGVDVSWNRWQLPEIGTALQQVERSFQLAQPEQSGPALLSILLTLDQAPLPAYKLDELHHLTANVLGLYAEAWYPTPTLPPGMPPRAVATPLVRVVNRSGVAASLKTRRNRPVIPLTRNHVQQDTALMASFRRYPSSAYWLAESVAPGTFRYPWQGHPDLGMPELHPREAVLEILPGEAVSPLATQHRLAGLPPEVRQLVPFALKLNRPAYYKWVDPQYGERIRPIEITPPVLVTVPTQALVFGDGKSRSVSVRVTSGEGAQQGSVRLEAPQGWSVSPASQPFSLAATDAETTLSFTVTPPTTANEGTLRAVAEVGGQAYDRGRIRVDYPHIPIQTVFPKAEVRVVRTDVQVAARRIGYVMGSGDEVPQALQQLGLDVVTLTDADFAQPLSGFDAIVVGIRAYNTEPRMRTWYPKLMDYVAQGGRLIVQYQIEGRGISPLAQKEIGPYPLTIGRDRVTEEDAPLVPIQANHPVLTAPNRLTVSDYAGWVQERGLYFASTWDPRYQPIFRAHDTGEKDLEGSLLVAPHGKGVFIYTGLAFFRQLPAGVPGAYRLFANLLSLTPQALTSAVK